MMTRIVNVVRGPHSARIANTKRVWSIALVALVVALTSRDARAESVRIPMMLVDAPNGFDTARFVTSLETYVTNAAVVVVPRAGGGDDVVCVDAVAAGRLAQVPVALWARWASASNESGVSNTSGLSMTLSMVVVEKGCGAIESSAVDVTPDQPDFVYRVAALKVASLLRVLPETAPVEPTKGATDDSTPTVPRSGLAWNSGGARVAAPYYGTIELGVTGVASAESAARTYALVASVWLKTHFYATRESPRGTRFMVGLSLLASAAHEVESAGGSGSARLFGALVGGRMFFARSGRVALLADANMGVATVWSSADRSNGADAMSERVWTPIASLAPHVRFKVTLPFHITAGPTIDVSRSIDLTLGDTPLYHASWLRFRWDIRAQLWF
jgi:hypothetical protein